MHAYVLIHEGKKPHKSSSWLVFISCHIVSSSAWSSKLPMPRWGIPHILCKLIKPKQYMNFSIEIGFINMSAGFSTVDFLKSTSRTKWYLMSMCLVLSWYIWFLVRCMTLSQYTWVASYTCPKSLTKPLSHKASLAASVVARYSAFVVERATVDCKTAFQLIAQPKSMKT